MYLHYKTEVNMVHSQEWIFDIEYLVFGRNANYSACPNVVCLQMICMHSFNFWSILLNLITLSRNRIWSSIVVWPTLAVKWRRRPSVFHHRVKQHVNFQWTPHSQAEDDTACLRTGCGQQSGYFFVKSLTNSYSGGTETVPHLWVHL